MTWLAKRLDDNKVVHLKLRFGKHWFYNVRLGGVTELLVRLLVEEITTTPGSDELAPHNKMDV